MSLNSFREKFAADTAPDMTSVMLRADTELISSNLAEPALEAGDIASDFTLEDPRGGTILPSRMSFVEVDHPSRSEPGETLPALIGLRNEDGGAL
jgi:hypothetical protein